MKRIIPGVLACMALVLSTTPVTAGDKADESARRAIFKVSNLSCGGCFYTINTALKPMEGFSGMGANLLRSLVAVDFRPPLTAEAIGKTITGLGYPATMKSLEPVEKEETFAFLESGRRGGFGGSCCPGGGYAGAGSGCSYVPGTSKDTDDEKQTL